MDLNIICFLWNGDRWDGKDRGPEYVNKLYRATQRNLSLPHRFICLTSNPDGIQKEIECIPLHSPSWKGCLPKICMFNPNLGLKGQVFSMDIDIVITGSLDDMCSHTGDFTVRSKFKPGEEYKLDGDIVGFKVGYGIDNIWKPFKENPKRVEELTGGRERYWYRHAVGECDRWQDLFPGQLLSYKRHIRNKPLPKNTRIVSCHGNPRPHQLSHNWAINNWR